MLKIAWSPRYVLPLPVNHRFPMSKYEVLPMQLLHEGTVHEHNFFAPDPIDDLWVHETHEPVYWNKLKTLTLEPKEVRRTGFPLSRPLIEREALIVNGTLQCATYAREHGIAMN